MNGYIKFVMDSANTSLKPIDTNETSTELTHEEVIELFEEACKEIDEWKPNNQKTILMTTTTTTTTIAIAIFW